MGKTISFIILVTFLLANSSYALSDDLSENLRVRLDSRRNDERIQETQKALFLRKYDLSRYLTSEEALNYLATVKEVASLYPEKAMSKDRVQKLIDEGKASIAERKDGTKIVALISSIESHLEFNEEAITGITYMQDDKVVSVILKEAPIFDFVETKNILDRYNEDREGNIVTEKEDLYKQVMLVKEFMGLYGKEKSIPELMVIVKDVEDPRGQAALVALEEKGAVFSTRPGWIFKEWKTVEKAINEKFTIATERKNALKLIRSLARKFAKNKIYPGHTLELHMLVVVKVSQNTTELKDMCDYLLKLNIEFDKNNIDLDNPFRRWGVSAAAKLAQNTTELKDMCNQLPNLSIRFTKGDAGIIGLMLSEVSDIAKDMEQLELLMDLGIECSGASSFRYTLLTATEAAKNNKELEEIVHKIIPKIIKKMPQDIVKKISSEIDWLTVENIRKALEIEKTHGDFVIEEKEGQYIINIKPSTSLASNPNITPSIPALAEIQQHLETIKGKASIFFGGSRNLGTKGESFIDVFANLIAQNKNVRLIIGDDPTSIDRLAIAAFFKTGKPSSLVIVGVKDDEIWRVTNETMLKRYISRGDLSKSEVNEYLKAIGIVKDIYGLSYGEIKRHLESEGVSFELVPSSMTSGLSYRDKQSMRGRWTIDQLKEKDDSVVWLFATGDSHTSRTFKYAQGEGKKIFSIDEEKVTYVEPQHPKAETVKTTILTPSIPALAEIQQHLETIKGKAPIENIHLMRDVVYIKEYLDAKKDLKIKVLFGGTRDYLDDDAKKFARDVAELLADRGNVEVLVGEDPQGIDRIVVGTMVQRGKGNRVTMVGQGRDKRDVRPWRLVDGNTIKSYANVERNKITKAEAQEYLNHVGLGKSIDNLTAHELKPHLESKGVKFEMTPDDRIIGLRSLRDTGSARGQWMMEQLGKDDFIIWVWPPSDKNCTSRTFTYARTQGKKIFLFTKDPNEYSKVVKTQGWVSYQEIQLSSAEHLPLDSISIDEKTITLFRYNAETKYAYLYTIGTKTHSDRLTPLKDAVKDLDQEKETYFIVSDPHGTTVTINVLFKALKNTYKGKVKMAILGDWVDRGPAWIAPEMWKEADILVGNHDLWFMLAALGRPDYITHAILHGYRYGKEAMDNMIGYLGIDRKLIEKFKNLAEKSYEGISIEEEKEKNKIDEATGISKRGPKSKAELAALMIYLISIAETDDYQFAKTRIEYLWPLMSEENANKYRSIDEIKEAIKKHRPLAILSEDWQGIMQEITENIKKSPEAKKLVKDVLRSDLYKIVEAGSEKILLMHTVPWAMDQDKSVHEYEVERIDFKEFLKWAKIKELKVQKDNYRKSGKKYLIKGFTFLQFAQFMWERLREDIDNEELIQWAHTNLAMGEYALLYLKVKNFSGFSFLNEGESDNPVYKFTGVKDKSFSFSGEMLTQRMAKDCDVDLIMGGHISKVGTYGRLLLIDAKVSRKEGTGGFEDAGAAYIDLSDGKIFKMENTPLKEIFENEEMRQLMSHHMGLTEWAYYKWDLSWKDIKEYSQLGEGVADLFNMRSITKDELIGRIESMSIGLDRIEATQLVEDGEASIDGDERKIKLLDVLKKSPRWQQCIKGYPLRVLSAPSVSELFIKDSGTFTEQLSGFPDTRDQL
ncbi:MAG: metallophosphoesterase family protein [Candidatus Gorgyraea atricola]|nr:metallophosphoesterase family protein [Candidatus Gorgyraea atricola]